MYMISNNKYICPNDKIAGYIVSFDTVAKLRIVIGKMKGLIEFAFSDEVLNHNSITSKLHKNLLMILTFGFYKLYGEAKYKNINFGYVRSAIRKTNKEVSNKTYNKSKINLNNFTIKNSETLVKLFKDYMTELGKKNIVDTDDDSDEEENDDGEEEEEVAEIVEVKKVTKTVSVKGGKKGGVKKGKK
jgi:hypothetical protein